MVGARAKIKPRRLTSFCAFAFLSASAPFRPGRVNWPPLQKIICDSAFFSFLLPLSM
jgi:hypothetical protein